VFSSVDSSKPVAALKVKFPAEATLKKPIAAALYFKVAVVQKYVEKVREILHLNSLTHFEI
jgi:hypothetical protein